MLQQVKLAAVVVGVCCMAANAATIPLGASGWEATWDSSFDTLSLINIEVISVTSDAVHIQKSAEFIQGPGLGGLFPTIPITFRQTAASTITQIVIEDEIITNSTGVDWTDFHFDLLDGGDALFDDSSIFDTAPFLNQSFSPDGQTFSVNGFGLGPGGTNEVVAKGEVWTPGAGGGDLIIDVVSRSQTPWTTFVLKETPTPEPTALMLLGIGALALFPRRRSR